MYIKNKLFIILIIFLLNNYISISQPLPNNRLRTSAGIRVERIPENRQFNGPVQIYNQEYYSKITINRNISITFEKSNVLIDTLIMLPGSQILLKNNSNTLVINNAYVNNGKINGNGKNGKNGIKGANGRSGLQDKNKHFITSGEKGEDGTNGSNGENGKDLFLYVNFIKISKIVIELNGGNGGFGGDGGNGGEGFNLECNDKKNINTGGKGGEPGNAGSGGNINLYSNVKVNQLNVFNNSGGLGKSGSHGSQGKLHSPPNCDVKKVGTIKQFIINEGNSGKKGEFSFGEYSPIRPPKPTAMIDITDYVFTKNTIGEFDAFLDSVLVSCGYHNKSYFQTINGIAILTGLENIDNQGKTIEGENRWVGNKDIGPQFYKSGFLERLFLEKKGAFRMISYHLINTDLETGNIIVTKDILLDILKYSTQSRLKTEFKNIPFRQYKVFAFVYHFLFTENKKPFLLTEPIIDAKDHLINANIWYKLTQPIKN